MSAGAASPYRSPHPVARLVPVAAIALACAALFAWQSWDARRRRDRRESVRAEQLAAARAVGPELALHSASRWLRHPTRSEPWAAVSDAPAVLDLDPAGALVPPPREVLGAGVSPLRVTRRGRAP